MKQTLFRKVMVKERLPQFEGDAYHSTFITDDGVVGFDKIRGWEEYYDPDWWLEEIELPSEEELTKEFGDINVLSKEDGAINNAITKSLWAGANYILSKLK